MRFSTVILPIHLGITELVVHWPIPDSHFAADLAVFGRIATDGLAQLS